MGLFKRKNSPYYFMKFQANGVRVYESTKTKNRKLAEEMYLNRRAEIITGIEPIRRFETNDMTFSELADKYLEFIKGRQKSAKNKSYVINALVKKFGNLRLIQFSVEVVEKIQTDLLKEKSIVSSNRILAILQAMFTKANDWEFIGEDVLKRVRKVKLLKGENKRLRYLSEEESERLISACSKELKPIVITALNTGMRKSEILHLTWDRVDLKNRIILLDKTKNGERREIPINQTLLNTLSGITRHIKCNYVFYNPETLKPFIDLKRSFAAALKKVHIIDFHFHDLRHTFASRLVMGGVDLTTVKELLGHKDIKMTLRYSHLSQSHIKDAVNILDDSCKIVAVDRKDKIEEE
ncbi:MAG: tyrosine-type recombinase/integrase [bacterium]